MNSRIVTEGVKFALQKEWGFNPLLRKGSKWFNWLAASDPKTCAVCRGYYGQIRGSLDDWPVLPPVHFNCRCFIDYTDAIAVGTATINGTDGADWHLLMNGTLPDYYISTADAKELGWNGENNLHVVANGKQIGGDRFYDYGKKLPFAVGRIWYEADINYKEGVRKKHRIVYSNDGLVFVTYDLYETFFEIIGVAGNKKVNPQTGGSTRYSNLQDAIDDYGGEASLLDVVKKAREMGGDSTGGGTSGTGGTKGPNPNTDDSEEYVYWSDSYNVNYRTKPVVGNGGKVYYYTQYYSFITGWRYFDIYDYNPQQMSQSKGSGDVEKYIKDNGISILNPPNRESQVAFLNSILKGAVSEYLRTGIPWQVTMAQAAMETGWGDKTPIDIYTGSSSNNIFGIKYAGSPTDGSKLFVRSWTFENINDSDLSYWEKEHVRWALNGESLQNTGERDKNGKLIIKVIQPFKAYASRDECIIAHSQTLENGYYDEAMKYKNDPYKFLEAIAPIYASDSSYYDNGVIIINKYLNWKGK